MGKEDIIVILIL